MNEHKQDNQPDDPNIVICGFKLKEEHFITEDRKGNIHLGIGMVILIILLILLFA